MASMKLVACVVLLMCMIFAPISDAISCGTVTINIAPCIGYVRGGAGPSSRCCAGVERLNDAAVTTPDRQATCKCLKSTASAIPGLNDDLAAGLPSKCGVNIPYKIGSSTDCTTIKA